MIVFGSPIPYDIRITGSSNQGFIVTVGCATLTFTDKEEMIHAIREYLNDPKGVEKVYNQSCGTQQVEETPPDRGHTHNMQNRHTRSPINNEAQEDCQRDECGPDPAARR